MRIAIDARLYGPAKNKGLGRYIEQLVKNLEFVDIKNEYIVLLRKENWDECVFQESTLRQNSGSSTRSLDSLAPTSPFGAAHGFEGPAVARDDNFKKVLADYKWYSFAEQIFLPIKLWRMKCDLVHFPHFNVPLLYFGKFVVTIHDLIMYKFPNERATTKNKLVYKIKYWLHKVVIKSAVKRAKQIIVVSEHTKRDLIKEFGIVENKISVIYLGYEVGGVNRVNKIVNKVNNTTSVLEKYGIKKPYLLYIGNAYPHKNLEMLIRAFELVKNKFNDLQLILVGKDDYFYDKLKSDANLRMHSNDTNGIIFTDYISNGGLVELYKNAQAYIFPSLYEGFGLPGLEAMSYGLPVVSSNTSCLPEIYGEAALYFNPNDIDDMSKKIIQILGNGELRRDLTSNGFEQIKKYSWRDCAKKTLSVYAHLLIG